MHRPSRNLGLLLTLAATRVLAATPPTEFLPSREVVLQYHARNPHTVTRVDLWVARENTEAWELVPADESRPGVVRYTVADDGAYAFFLVLWNDAGPSSPAPTPDTAPLIRAIVDTGPPLLQLNDCRYVAGLGPRTIRLDTRIADENLAPEGVRVFYRTSGHDTWHDGGPVVQAPTSQDDAPRPPRGPLVWSPPNHLAGRCDIRLLAVDRAGNRGMSQTASIDLPPSIGDTSSNDPAAPPAVTVADVEPPAIDSVTAVSVPPVAAPEFAPYVPARPVADGPPDDSPTTQPAAPPDPEGVRHLRALAAQFTAEGRYGLALTRLEQALALAPHDPAALVDYGSVLYRQRRYDPAQERFAAALRASGNHAGALEGLALVAATQKRYADARRYLLRLQELRPDSGQIWLRSGDIEHKLGDSRAALAAWRRALEVADADDDLRDKARRRLEYFGDPPTFARPTESLDDARQALDADLDPRHPWRRSASQEPRPD